MIPVPDSMMKNIRRAIVEFELLAPGDRVLVGLSGGKDSSLLLHALCQWIPRMGYPVQLGGYYADLGFYPKEEADNSMLESLCEAAGVPFYSERKELGDAILNDPKESPCARCSYLRRALIHNFARNHGYNKVAFAHHLDDAVETFLMSILFSGQIQTFKPKTFLDRTQVTVIRPLVYVREKEVVSAVRKLGISPKANPCPMNGITKRAYAKDLLARLCSENTQVFEHLVSAMREGREIQLWPPKPERVWLREKSQEFWGVR